MLKEEEIVQNWDIFCNLAENGTGDRSEAIKVLLDELGERIGECSSSTKSVPGSLVDQNLKALKACITLNSKFKLGLSKESMIIVNLFRNIGMIGTLDEKLMEIQDSEWHKKRGDLFKYNQELPFMRTYDRSIQLLQHFGVKITPDEHVAILTSGGTNEEYNKYKEPPLAFATYTALRLVAYMGNE